MPTAFQPVLRNCPACNAPLAPGNVACVSCGMSLEKMRDYRRAQLAAHARATRSITTVQEGRHEILRQALKPLVWLFVLAVLIGGGIVVYRNIVGSSVPPWKTYPTDRAALVARLMALIHSNTDADLDKAYALVSLSARDPTDDNELSHYRQLFHELNKYLAGEFGADWDQGMKIEPDGPGGDGSQYVVTVSTEKLHVGTAEERPKNGPAPSEKHYGITGIAEFPVDEAGADMQAAVVGGVLRGVGAGGSAKQLEGILAVGGRHRRSPMQTKRQILPIVRNPNDPGLNWRVILQLWPMRQDPTVRARLQQIAQDARYAPEIQQFARKILDESVTTEELVGAGVPD